MRGFGFVPEWQAPGRTNERAYFPVSISATVPEATFSETLTSILDADPSHSPSDLEEAFKNLSSLAEKSETADELWTAFKASYVTSPQGFGSSKGRNSYIVPFHRAIATAMQVDQRQWGRLYWLLMTDPDRMEIDTELHEEFVRALYEMQPSNLLEELIINAVNNLDGVEIDSSTDDIRVDDPIAPLIPGCADGFQQDLRAWLMYREPESTSRWMQGLRDILCFHYMMYVIQVAKGLAEEYDVVEHGPPYNYEFELNPIYFGLAHETASQSRRFATEFSDGGLSRALYDSWGRLAVLSHIVDIGLDDETDVDSKPYTLTEALNEFPRPLQQKVVDELLDEFSDDQRPEGEYELAEAAVRFSHTVRRYYENMAKSRTSQTAYSAGENTLRDLGRGSDRKFIEARQRVGTILRLDRSSLRLFARLFDAQVDRGHIDEFWVYMRNRGIQFDHQSKQALIDQLEGMGLLQKQSDSGEAMYVETI